MLRILQLLLLSKILKIVLLCLNKLPYQVQEHLHHLQKPGRDQDLQIRYRKPIHLHQTSTLIFLLNIVLAPIFLEYSFLLFHSDFRYFPFLIRLPVHLEFQ